MTAQVETTDVNEQAREVYRQSLAAEMPMTGRQLGEMFGKSERWGRARRAEVASTPAAEDVPESGNPQVEVPAQHPARDAASAAQDAAWLDAARHEPAQYPAPADLERHAAPSTAPVAARHKPGAYGVAWCSFAFGIVVSVAANVAHVFYPSTAVLREFTDRTGKAAADWSPDLGAVLGAGFWPVALLLTVELLTRVAWPTGWAWGLTRYGGTGLVAAVAAVMSYRHMAGLLAAWGEDAFSAHLGPLAVDGLMVVAGMALLAMSATRDRTRHA